MMYNLKSRSPELLDCRDIGIQLRSCSNVRFKEYKLNSEIYVKCPYVRGCNLWKQLPAYIQTTNTMLEFKKVLTDDLMKTLSM